MSFCCKAFALSDKKKHSSWILIYTIHGLISVLFYIKIFGLFTKREGWVDISQDVLCVLIDPDKAEVINNKVNKNSKNEFDQYPAILPKQAWSMKYLLHGQENGVREMQTADLQTGR